jgi:hypothetical protein
MITNFQKKKKVMCVSNPDPLSSERQKGKSEETEETTRVRVRVGWGVCVKMS